MVERLTETHKRAIKMNVNPGDRCAPIAQLDRATDYESVGRGFESLWAH